MARRVCGTCGHGATSKLLENLKEVPTPKANRSAPPKNKSKQEKASLLALEILRKLDQ